MCAKFVKGKKKKPGSHRRPGHGSEGAPITRARIPRQHEVLGIIEQRYGGSKMLVRCVDKKERNCRVPGRMRRKLWLREGNFILVEPWEFDNDRGDVIFKYTPAEVEWLRRHGYIPDDFSQSI